MGALFYTSSAFTYKLSPVKSDYFFHLTQNWYNLFAKYPETTETMGSLKLPANARPSRKKLHEKLERYRQRVRKFPC
jgi:hypothetical protein